MAPPGQRCCSPSGCSCGRIPPTAHNRASPLFAPCELECPINPPGISEELYSMTTECVDREIKRALLLRETTSRATNATSTTRSSHRTVTNARRAVARGSGPGRRLQRMLPAAGGIQGLEPTPATEGSPGINHSYAPSIFMPTMCVWLHQRGASKVATVFF